MKNISLLPAEFKSYKLSAKRISRYVMVLSALILVFVVVYVVLSLTAAIPQRELASVREQRTAIQKKAAELQPYADMADRTGTVKKLVSVAMGTNPEWSDLFIRIFNTVPDGIWLNDFNASYKDGSGDMSIKGRADSNTEVAGWLAALKKLDGLSDAQCGFTARDGSADGGGVQFEIRITLHQGNGQKNPAEGGAANER